MVTGTGRFPADFVWGASAAAYQVEGAALEDGKGPSVWDMFVRKGGTIWGGQTGDVACDHYHRFRQDVALMREIGLPSYRFSISWPRVLPQGIGSVNPKGLGFYDQLVDELLAANVTPYVTLFHWDYPYELYIRGGWLNPASPDWFADYTRVIVERLSDRVQYWFTLNEPQCFIGLGLQEGRHAPGDRLGFAQILQAAHHALLAHGKAVQVIRARAKRPPAVSLALVSRGYMPATSRRADVDAAQRVHWSIQARDVWTASWMADPIFLRQYPEDGLALFGADVPDIRSEDMDLIGQPLDFCGVNIYQGQYVREAASGEPEVVPFPMGHPQTAFRWNITPEALYWGPRFYWERYHVPIVISENGMSNADVISLDGQVHDPQRIDYTCRYLLELERAIRDGVCVRGYFHWSLTDNFEWAEGVKERFGLIYVDYPTQRRILKDSALWYREVIASNGTHLHECPLVYSR